MTERESEIFHIIQQNPAISQNELAAKLNLARSSVAVHIANLQKKGYLLGKGYIVNESAYVLGVGAANVDIHGRSKKSIVMHDSNPGHMNTSAGGVTRNVSRKPLAPRCERQAHFRRRAPTCTQTRSAASASRLASTFPTSMSQMDKHRPPTCP